MIKYFARMCWKSRPEFTLSLLPFFYYYYFTIDICHLCQERFPGLQISPVVLVITGNPVQQVRGSNAAR